VGKTRYGGRNRILCITISMYFVRRCWRTTVLTRTVFNKTAGLVCAATTWFNSASVRRNIIEGGHLIAKRKFAFARCIPSPTSVSQISPCVQVAQRTNAFTRLGNLSTVTFAAKYQYGELQTTQSFKRSLEICKERLQIEISFKSFLRSQWS